MKKAIFLLFIIILLISGCAQIEELDELDETAANITPSDEETVNESSKIEVPEDINKTETPEAEEPEEELVKVIGVSESGDECILNIKGITTVIEKGKSETINGVTVYVKEVIAVHSQTKDKDVCEIIVSEK